MPDALAIAWDPAWSLLVPIRDISSVVIPDVTTKGGNANEFSTKEEDITKAFEYIINSKPESCLKRNKECNVALQVCLQDAKKKLKRLQVKLWLPIGIMDIGIFVALCYFAHVA